MQLRDGEMGFEIVGFGSARFKASTFDAAMKMLARNTPNGIARLIKDATGQDYIGQAVKRGNAMMTKAEAVAIWIEAVGGGSTL